MSTDRETTRIVQSWLEDGVTALPDHVLDAVLDQVPATSQRRATWWPARRFATMNNALKFGLAAAAVVAVAAVIGLSYLGSTNVGGPGLDSSTPTPEVTPTATPEPTSESSGTTHDLSIPEFPLAIDVTLPSAAWSRDAQGGVVTRGGAEPPDGAGIIAFVDAGYYVYGDPCRWSTTRPETPSTTVDALVAALSAQASRDASEPVDITLDAYAGKSITLHVPDDVDFADCDEDQFASWGVRGEDPARYHQGPGQIDKLWIVDVDGHLVVIDTAHYADTPQEVVDELDTIVESATFEARR